MNLSIFILDKKFNKEKFLEFTIGKKENIDIITNFLEKKKILEKK